MSNWEGDDAPVVGQRVLAADGGSERIEAVVAELRSHMVVLEFPEFLSEHGTAETRGRSWAHERSGRDLRHRALPVARQLRMAVPA